MLNAIFVVAIDHKTGDMVAIHGGDVDGDGHEIARVVGGAENYSVESYIELVRKAHEWLAVNYG